MGKPLLQMFIGVNKNGVFQNIVVAVYIHILA